MVGDVVTGALEGDELTSALVGAEVIIPNAIHWEAGTEELSTPATGPVPTPGLQSALGRILQLNDDSCTQERPGSSYWLHTRKQLPMWQDQPRLLSVAESVDVA